jgi:hypothetical protein
VLKKTHFLDADDIKSSVKKILTDIPVQDFKNCFEQWPKHWEHDKQLEGDYFEKLCGHRNLLGVSLTEHVMCNHIKLL